MNPTDIKTVDDFEKLSSMEKLEFKNIHPLAYKGLFAATNVGNQPVKFDLGDHKKEVNFHSSDIKTVDDFEKLSLAGKAYLTEEFPDQYKALFK